jgi:hypothetical protein
MSYVVGYIPIMHSLIHLYKKSGIWSPFDCPKSFTTASDCTEMSC